MKRLAGVAILCLASGCVDSTGSALVTFRAVAAGPEGATGLGLEGDTALGYHVTLTRAVLHIGGVYLKLSPPRSGAQPQACVQVGSAQFYSGQVREGLDVNVLSGEAQPFPGGGEGTSDTSPVAELWLLGEGSSVEQETDNGAVLSLEGTVAKAGTTSPFVAKVTISAGNRGDSSTDPAQPGAHPICAERIVTPILAGFVPTEGGTLLVRVDPLAWFQNVEFSDVPADPRVPGRLAFPDNNDDQQSQNLFAAVHSTAAYVVTFTPAVNH